MIKQRRRSNVVARMDFSRHHGFTDLVMGSTYRQSLADVVHRCAAPSHSIGEAEPLAIAIPVAEGLAQAYRQGGLHRP